MSRISWEEDICIVFYRFKSLLTTQHIWRRGWQGGCVWTGFVSVWELNMSRCITIFSLRGSLFWGTITCSWISELPVRPAPCQTPRYLWRPALLPRHRRWVSHKQHHDTVFTHLTEPPSSAENIALGTRRSGATGFTLVSGKQANLIRDTSQMHILNNMSAVEGRWSGWGRRDKLGSFRGERSGEMRCNHRLVQLGLVSLVHTVEGGGRAAIPNQNREFASKARAALQPSTQQLPQPTSRWMIQSNWLFLVD